MEDGCEERFRVCAVVLFLLMLLIDGQISADIARAATLNPGTIIATESFQYSSVPNDILIAVDPTTGATTTISDNTVGSGPSFNFGTTGAFITYVSQESDGSLLVVDSSDTVALGLGSGPYESRIYRVDPATGNRTLIVDSTGTTPDNAINAAREVGNTIFATTKAGIETVDPITGAVSPFTIDALVLFRRCGAS